MSISLSVFNCVNKHVIQLSYRWKIYCQLFDSGPENIALLNLSGKEVFKLFQRLVLDDTILALSRLTDPPSSGKDKDNANIKYILVHATDKLSSNVSTELNITLARLEGHVKNLRVHRDKALAHADLKHELQVEALPQITYDELESAMHECRTLMSKVGSVLFKQTSCYDVIVPFGSGGYDLLSILNKAHVAE
jgi:AbiU2